VKFGIAKECVNLSIDRGIFLVPWGGLDAHDLADHARRASADSVCMSVKDSTGRAWCRSDVVRSWRLAGDPLEAACKSVHAGGMKLRASVAVFADAYLGQRRPEALARGLDGVPAARPGWEEDWYYHLCPTQPEQRDRTVAFVSELVSRYEVDAIDLDFIRFPWKPAGADGPERRFCFCATCRSAFQAATGASVEELGNPAVDAAWWDWRAETISAMVADVATAAGDSVPVAPFIAVWGSEGFGRDELQKARQRFGQDHRQLGSMCERLSPMLYHEFTDEPTCFIKRAKRWVADMTSHLKDLNVSVCTVVQGGPPAPPMAIIDVVRGAVDAGADALMSYPGLSWTLDNEYWRRLGEAYRELEPREIGIANVVGA
jgi:uncharacterized lipoprotein YddW (UPF0748 family)